MSRLLSLCFTVLLATSSVAAPSSKRPIDLSADGARIYGAPGLAPLTLPSSADQSDVVRQFLATRGRGAAAQRLVTASASRRDGLTHLRMGQHINGLPVYGAYVKATLDDQGQILHVIENLVTPGRVAPAGIDEDAAFTSALGFHYPGRAAFDADFWYRPPTATAVVVPLADGTLEAGYLVETWERRSNILWHSVIDSEGSVIHAELRTNTADTYAIIPIDPVKTAQTTVSGNSAWVTNNTTIGPNVDAYLDRDNNNSADSNGRPVSSTRDFIYPFDGTVAPTTTTNQMLAVTNLFYLNNIIHDKLERHGFTEAAGNFEGDDPVNAEAQDGGGTNNANFSTPSDGSRPRMQMYLWTYSTPERDGDLDSDIVWHEYGHGLTWRMIGSMSGPLAGAIGEGMSDTLSIYVNDNDVVGEYSYNNPKGIRRYAYTNYPLTYGDVTGSSVHNDGEIYAATMWKLRQLWLADGYTEDSLFDTVVGGMNFTPSRPAYEDMRDGILAQASGAHDCIVWKAFAQFGIGEGADGTESCRIFTCSVSITESFTVPSACEGTSGNTTPVVTISSPANNASYATGTSVTFSGSATDGDGDALTSLAWTSSLDGSIGTGESFSRSDLSVGTHTISASTSDGQSTGSSSITLTITSSEPAGITLTASARKVKGVVHVDLNWSGTTATNVDVYRNDANIATTANDGSYTDNTGLKGGGSLTYRVCEAGTQTCSGNATVSY